MQGIDQEIRSGERFRFGANWSRFLKVVTQERIGMAESSLRSMLEVDDLRDRSFLDVGSGSGLFSLAARNLGARVHSLDYDPQSVACTQELKRRHYPEDHQWTVEEGSVLDRAYLSGLGSFDIVYSWGVLHHTGDMFQALNNVVPLVKNQGLLFIAIYNDQGEWSRIWTVLKKTYNKLPGFLRLPYAFLVLTPREMRSLVKHTLKGKPLNYVKQILEYSRSSSRGMSYFHDKIDWIGGYPFEVAKPEVVFDLYRHQGFVLKKLKTCAGGLGCNEYVFRRQGG